MCGFLCVGVCLEGGAGCGVSTQKVHPVCVPAGSVRGACVVLGVLLSCTFSHDGVNRGRFWVCREVCGMWGGCEVCRKV
jgi:hypothetical protein